MGTLVGIQGVSKFYEKHQALKEVTFSIEKGAIFGLLGPNGAGKTSLIRILNQITAPDEGTIHLNGEQLRPEHVEDIGYLPEERGLYRKMKVGEQALYLAQLKGMDKPTAIKQLKEWFTRLEIEGWWDKKVESLSKGMQQKVQFITTIIHKPSLIILDEPFSGFDPINTVILKEEILRLREEGATIIFSTHNMNSVEEICDQIVLLNKGEKVLEGTVDGVKQKFGKRIFNISARGNVVGIATAIGHQFEMVEGREKDGVKNIKLKAFGSFKTNELLQAIMPHAEIVSFQEEIPSMNEVFIEAVQAKTKNNE